MKKILKFFDRKILRKFPRLYYSIAYKSSAYRVRASYSDSGKKQKRSQLFQNFLEHTHGKACLQIGVKEHIGKKFGSNWVSVDKFDSRNFIDYQYDIHDLKFEDSSFDAVVCWSILEHIPYPQKAISELRRVLKPGGAIWVQSPFIYPYHEGPKDYWRISPDGLRIWMSDFKEIDCGCDYWAKTPLVAASYFHGIKNT